MDHFYVSCPSTKGQNTLYKNYLHEGVKSQDLVAILDFIHYVNVNACQKDLEWFLILANDRQRNSN